MVQNFKKEIVISLRQDGFSYSSIAEQIRIPKSTVAFWLKKIKLDKNQKEKLKNRKLESQKMAAQKKISRTLRQIEQVKRYSSQDIKNISSKELWLMGIMLYWRERYANKNEIDLKKGVNFTSSDPYLIKFFIKWLKDIGKIENNEITLDLFINSDGFKNSEIVVSYKKSIIDYWSNVTGFSRDKFLHIYRLKTKKRHIRTPNGFLRIRVKASSMLARQIAGWIEGIQNFYWKELN